MSSTNFFVLIIIFSPLILALDVSPIVPIYFLMSLFSYKNDMFIIDIANQYYCDTAIIPEINDILMGLQKTFTNPISFAIFTSITYYLMMFLCFVPLIETYSQSEFNIIIMVYFAVILTHVWLMIKIYKYIENSYLKIYSCASICYYDSQHNFICYDNKKNDFYYSTKIFSAYSLTFLVFSSISIIILCAKKYADSTDKIKNNAPNVKSNNDNITHHNNITTKIIPTNNNDNNNNASIDSTNGVSDDSDISVTTGIFISTDNDDDNNIPDGMPIETNYSENNEML